MGGWFKFATIKLLNRDITRLRASVLTVKRKQVWDLMMSAWYVFGNHTSPKSQCQTSYISHVTFAYGVYINMCMVQLLIFSESILGVATLTMVPDGPCLRMCTRKVHFKWYQVYMQLKRRWLGKLWYEWGVVTHLGNPYFMFKKLPCSCSPLPCLCQVLSPKQSAFGSTLIKEKIAVDKTFGLKNKNKSKACALLPARHVEHDVTTICWCCEATCSASSVSRVVSSVEVRAS